MSVRSADMSAGSTLTSDGWFTPKWLADALGRFDLDPCSNVNSHVRASMTASLDGTSSYSDGLAVIWAGRSVFVNPPYSNVMPWARKLTEHTGPWVALLKLDPTTKWWAELMRAMPAVAPFRKRIKFEGTLNMTANFPSVLVYNAWRPPVALRPHLWLPTYGDGA